ncbi:uncharacterized protein LOC107046158 [Diachasma alloeum]|uniref:uncharacterized protein LOC107046158 n=2 Tax=Diachasma alloeum TaxID=454923 RepID=UPI0007384F13|nr:uncharacterized protein LOC107046158 [Diachasma alloeum]
MEDILKIQKSIVFDESVSHYEMHTHQPFASSSYGNNDVISITVQHQDLCLLPSKSHLHIYGRLTKDNGTTPTERTRLVSNAICHLFEEVRYELNGVEIDRVKNVGLTSLMKNYVSQSPNQWFLMENAGWLKNDSMDSNETITDNAGYFDISIPLSLLLGFAEDYQKIVVNAKHELIITRSKTDICAVLQRAVNQQNPEEKWKINLQKIEWLIPYVKVSDERKVKLLNFIAKDTPITMGFRTWELYEYPLLPATSKHVWVVKTSSQLEKPRYVILGFQTNRKNIQTANASHFDHCSIRDVKLFLNSESYPYGNLNLDIAINQYSTLYNMYVNFQESYYGKEAEPLLNREKFLTDAPLIVIDCSKQNEYLKTGPVDIRLEFESSFPFAPNTSAYCLILHDRIVEYNPISGGVKKLV